MAPFQLLLDRLIMV